MSWTGPRALSLTFVIRHPKLQLLRVPKSPMLRVNFSTQRTSPATHLARGKLTVTFTFACASLGWSGAAIAAVGGPSAATYGEITSEGFADLCRDHRIKLSKMDVFADLGSGMGRCVVQAAQDFGVQRACGVEMALSRHHSAVASLSRGSTEVASRVQFFQGDCVEPLLWEPAGAPLRGVTVLYVASLLFSKQLMARLAQRIVEGAAGGTHQLRAVATLKRFRRGALRPAGLRERLPPAMIRMTWNPNQPVYIYVRK